MVFRVYAFALMVFRVYAFALRVFRVYAFAFRVFRVYALGLRVFRGYALGLRVFRVYALGLRVFRVYALGLRVFRVYALGLRVCRAYGLCTNVVCLLRLEMITSKRNSSCHFAIVQYNANEWFSKQASQKDEVKSTWAPPEKFVETHLKPTLIRENSNKLCFWGVCLRP